jgi:hypothetical protein
MQFSTSSYYFIPLRSTAFSTQFLIADMELDIDYASMRTVTVHRQSVSSSVTEKMFSFEKCGFLGSNGV